LSEMPFKCYSVRITNSFITESSNVPSLSELCFVLLLQLDWNGIRQWVWKLAFELLSVSYVWTRLMSNTKPLVISDVGLVLETPQEQW